MPHVQASQEEIDEIRAGEVISICKLCKRERYHAKRGFVVALVCIQCTKKLPPAPAGMRRCPDCLELHERKGRVYCLPCNRARANSRYDHDKAREAHLRSTYNITTDEYNLMFAQQGGLCAICKQPETAIDPWTTKIKLLAVDHNHALNQVRELLCAHCNVLVRFLEKDRSRVEQARDYLKRHDT